MRSSASCSSAKTEVAPTNSSSTPKAAAGTLSPRRLALSSRPCTASAPCVPSMPCSCAVDLAARRLLAEDETGDGDDDQQQRRDREDGVEGQRRAHALRVVLHPVQRRGLEQRHHGGRGSLRMLKACRSCDSSTAIGRVPGNSENTMVTMAVIGTARKAPGMPHSSDHTARLIEDGEGAQVQRVAHHVGVEEVADDELHRASAPAASSGSCRGPRTARSSSAPGRPRRAPSRRRARSSGRRSAPPTARRTPARTAP